MDICRKKGFAVEGIELAVDGAEYAERVLGLQIMRLPIEGIDRPPESYDVISFNNVLEHLADPMRGLRAAFRLLKRGGVLTLSVPNVTFGTTLRSIASVLGTRGATRAVLSVQVFQAPAHLTAFSRRTLVMAVATCGFEAIEVKSEYPVFNPHRTLWNTSKLIQYYGSEATRWLTRERLVIGHGMTLYATKPFAASP
jgi:2-polyprenyl-3-methyl-5-hydroxy-6-metoxy-1,4-benzoquinol methylase